MSLNERRTYDVAVLGAAATSWRGFCMRKRRDNRQWRKFGVMRSHYLIPFTSTSPRTLSCFLPLGNAVNPGLRLIFLV